MRDRIRLIPGGLAAALLIAAALYFAGPGIPFPCNPKPCLDAGWPEWICIWFCVPGIVG